MISEFVSINRPELDLSLLDRVVVRRVTCERHPHTLYIKYITGNTTIYVGMSTRAYARQ